MKTGNANNSQCLKGFPVLRGTINEGGEIMNKHDKQAEKLSDKADSAKSIGRYEIASNLRHESRRERYKAASLRFMEKTASYMN